jgi:hypothetical protein
MNPSSRSGMGGRRPTPDRRPNPAWSLLVIAVALIGGLAAAALVHESLVITVIVSVAVGAVTVLAVARWPGTPAELTDGRPEGQERSQRTRPFVEPSRPGPEYTRVDPRHGRTEPEHAGPGITERTESVVEVIPFSSRRDADRPPQPGAKDWWQQPAGPPSPQRSGSRPAPAPDLSTYLNSAVIAQCPRCGAFDLDIDHNRDPWAFHCRACDNTWAWRPGTPWPEVRVAPRLRRESRPPAP